MARKQSDDTFSEQETARRTEAILRGAFAGAPTPLKEIPTKDGKRRKLRATSEASGRAKRARSGKKDRA